MQERLRGQQWDVGAAAERIRRLARFDTTVFDEVRDEPGQTLPAVAIVLAGVLLAALGGWLWLWIEFDRLDTGRIIIREFLIGTIFAVLMWAVWVLIAELVLVQAYGLQVSRWALMRCMGYAAAPAALMLLVLIRSLSFGIGLVALAAWWALSGHAIRAAVPTATPAQVSVANLAGFALFTLVLSVLAHQAGMAPGVFVHAGGVGEYSSLGGVSIRR